MEAKKLTQSWFVPIAVFSALDAFTTIMILLAGGWEINPLMSPFVGNIYWIIIIKSIYILIVLGLAYIAEQKLGENAGWIVVGITSFITCLVVVWNTMVLVHI